MVLDTYISLPTKQLMLQGKLDFFVFFLRYFPTCKPAIENLLWRFLSMGPTPPSTHWAGPPPRPTEKPEQANGHKKDHERKRENPHPPKSFPPHVRIHFLHLLILPLDS